MDATVTKKVFALRRQGDLDAALAISRPYVRDNPADTWGVKALGWTLYDAVKRAIEANKIEEARGFGGELAQLKITEEFDELLFRQCTFIFKKLTPEAPVLAEAKKLSQEGDHVRAAELYRSLVKSCPGHVDAETSLGWELYRLLKEETDVVRVVAVLREYGCLAAAPKPDRLHSCILFEASKWADSWSNFSDFVRWWNTDNLTEEDWQTHPGKEGGDPYPSLAERTVTALYKHVKKYHKRGPAHQWMLPFVRKVLEKSSGVWIPYYLAKLSAWFEADMEGVKSVLLPLVKAKRQEFWAWQALAECVVDPDERHGCYAQAVLSHCADEGFKTELYHQFALFLAQEEHHETASLVIGRYLAIQTAHDRRPDPGILDLCSKPWYKKPEKDDLPARLHPLAELAQQMLFEDIPFLNANFVERIEGTDGRPPLLLVMIDGKGACKLKNRCRRDTLPERGEPIVARIFWPPATPRPAKPGDPPHGPPLGEILQWKPRQDGLLFDCAKSVLGVVSQVNNEKGFARVTLSVKSFGLLYYDRYAGAQDLGLGDVVAAWRQDALSAAEEFVHLLGYVKSARTPITNLFHDFEGEISIPEGKPFGFVRGHVDVFISPELVSRLNLVSNARVKGWALREWNKKREQPGWSAILLEVVG